MNWRNLYLSQLLLTYFHILTRIKLTVQWKHFSLKLGYAITVHNFQGSTCEHMKGDFDCTSKNGKPNTVPINQGAMYTICSCAKSRDKLKLVNFELGHSKGNTAVLQEILRIRQEALFSWNHSLRDPWDESGFIKCAIVEFPYTTFLEQLNISRELWYNLLLIQKNK